MGIGGEGGEGTKTPNLPRFYPTLPRFTPILGLARGLLPHFGHHFGHTLDCVEGRGTLIFTTPATKGGGITTLKHDLSLPLPLPLPLPFKLLLPLPLPAVACRSRCAQPVTRMACGVGMTIATSRDHVVSGSNSDSALSCTAMGQCSEAVCPPSTPTQRPFRSHRRMELSSDPPHTYL